MKSLEVRIEAEKNNLNSEIIKKSEFIKTINLRTRVSWRFCLPLMPGSFTSLLPDWVHGWPVADVRYLRKSLPGVWMLAAEQVGPAASGGGGQQCRYVEAINGVSGTKGAQ